MTYKTWCIWQNGSMNVNHKPQQQKHPKMTIPTATTTTPPNYIHNYSHNQPHNFDYDYDPPSPTQLNPQPPTNSLARAASRSSHLRRDAKFRETDLGFDRKCKLWRHQVFRHLVQKKNSDRWRIRRNTQPHWKHLHGWGSRLLKKAEKIPNLTGSTYMFLCLAAS